MIIDSHVNLHALQFDDDRDLVIKRAFDSGIGLMVNICDKVSNFQAVYQLAKDHADIYASVGTHPHEAKENPYLTPETLIALAAQKKVVGIGECGLDYFYDLSPREVQKAVFEVHIEAARQLDLPLIVHTRDADQDMIEILERHYAKAPFRFLLHCYTSGPELAARAAQIGAYFSVSGIASFKAAEEVRAIIKTMPEDRIIVETDCPYLAPVPHRGRRCEPAFVTHVYDTLAQIRGWDRHETELKTKDAFFRLFDRIDPRLYGG